MKTNRTLAESRPRGRSREGSAVSPPPPAPASRGWFPLRLAIFAVVLALFLANPSRHFSWDVMERGCFLKYPHEAPRWGFLFFAHLIEVPMAAGLGAVLPFRDDPVLLFRILESLFGALLALLLFDLCLDISGSRLEAVAFAFLLTVSFGFWRMAVSGEEKVAAAFFITLFLSIYLPQEASGRHEEKPAASRPVWAGVVLGVSALVHLMALILWAVIAIAVALRPLGIRISRYGIRESILIAVIGALIFAASIGAAATLYYGIANPRDIAKGMLLYHSPRFTFWYFSQPRAERSIRRNLGESVRGVEGVVLAPEIAERGGRRLAVSLLVVALAAVAAALMLAGRHPSIGGLLVFLILWAGLYLFYEPRNPESWLPAYPAFLVLVCALLSLPPPRVRLMCGIALGAAAFSLAVVNRSSFLDLRTPPALETLSRALDGALPPEALILVGSGAEQRYLRYYSNARFILVDHLKTGKADWCDRASVNFEGVERRLGEGRAVYATKGALRGLPPPLRRAARRVRLEGGSGASLYRLSPRAGIRRSR